MFVFRKPLFTIITTPKRKSSDAGSASKPKRSRDVLSISEKVKIMNMTEIETKKETSSVYDCTVEDVELRYSHILFFCEEH